MSEPRAGRVAVLGLGLMGGSLARALAHAGPVQLVGFDHDLVQTAAAQDGGLALEVATSAPEAVRAADVVVLATPLGALPELLAAIAPAVRPDALVMDITSLQRPALEAAQAAGLPAKFVSAHPLCGSDASGFAASRADLYEEAPVFLSVDGDPEADAPAAARAFWQRLGARPRFEDADAHDARMVRVSHLPQVVATALAAELADAALAAGDLGPGGRDMTRLAASDPGLWHDLLAVSGPQLAGPLDHLATRLHEFARALASGRTDRVTDVLRTTRDWRRA